MRREDDERPRRERKRHLVRDGLVEGGRPPAREAQSLDRKLQAIRDFDEKIVRPVMLALRERGVTFAILPDHPVPLHLRKHTRTPVPVAVCGPHIRPDSVMRYSEADAPKGSLGALSGDQFMKTVLNIQENGKGK